jgi:hypothetical protein
MSGIPRKIYYWNDYIKIYCRKDDKIKLKKIYALWLKKHKITSLSFNAWMSCVIFPRIYKRYKVYFKEIRKIENENKQRPDFV